MTQRLVSVNLTFCEILVSILRSKAFMKLLVPYVGQLFNLSGRGSRDFRRGSSDFGRRSEGF